MSTVYQTDYQTVYCSNRHTSHHSPVHSYNDRHLSIFTDCGQVWSGIPEHDWHRGDRLTVYFCVICTGQDCNTALLLSLGPSVRFSNRRALIKNSPLLSASVKTLFTVWEGLYREVSFTCSTHLFDCK